MGNISTMDATTPTTNNYIVKPPLLHTFHSPFLYHHDDNDNDNDNNNNNDNNPMRTKRNCNCINNDTNTNTNTNVGNQALPKKTLNALIILNSPIHNPPSPIFTKLWNISSIKICADGGANRLYHATVNENKNKNASADSDNDSNSNNDNNNNDNDSECYIPDLIRGDLDSLAPHVRKYYEERGVSVERDGDQNCNDLDKALSAVRKLLQTPDCNKAENDNENNNENENDNAYEGRGEDQEQMIQIYVYGAFGGRFDQEMASIQALYKWKDEFDYRIALYNDETCAMLLRPHARNEIYLPFHSKDTNGNGNDNSNGNGNDNDSKGNDNDTNEANSVSMGEGPTCGLIPIGCLCDGVETEGFKWNLDGSLPLEFGGLVSTSNRAEEPLLVVRCKQPLVFTAEILQQS